MKLYYLIDNEIDRNCLIDCPFKDIGFDDGRTGKECMLGSGSCQDCEYCYGHYDGPFIGVPINGDIKFRYERYVKCMLPHKSTFKLSLGQFFYRIKKFFKNGRF